MPRILVKQNDRTLDQYVVENGNFKVGRTPDNDIVLNDPSVSRSHLELKIEGTKITITDLGSSNGTYVNGIRISRTIATRAVVGVGVYTLEVSGLGDHKDDKPASQRGDDVEATMMIAPGQINTQPNRQVGSSGGIPARPAMGSGSGSITGPGMPQPTASNSGLPTGDGEEGRKSSWLGRLFGKK